MLYSVGNGVGEMVFRFEGYFEISMSKELCNIFGLWSCKGEGRPDCLSISVVGGTVSMLCL